MKIKRKMWVVLIGLYFLWGTPTYAYAASINKPKIPTSPLVNVSIGGGSNITSSVETFLIIAVISLAPSILIMFTCYTQVSIILSLTRRGLGTQTTPPTQVLVGLALFITIFIMSPVIQNIEKNAWTPLQKNQITLKVAAQRAETPLKKFMIKNTQKQDLEVFYAMKKQPMPKNETSVTMTELIPAYSITQITEGLYTGSLIYIAFLAIDIIVGFILMLLGMIMVPPVMISLPVKILTFVFIGGYSEIASLIFQTIKP